jgi:hypothetical protein
MAALLGMLSGIGGGMLRDVLVSEIPNVLRADLYAVSALAGAVVVGREGSHLRARVFVCACVLRVEQFGDAEIQQLGHTFERDEDVRGLDVAVDDEVLVRVRDSLTDGEEQSSASTTGGRRRAVWRRQAGPRGDSPQ